MFIDKHFKVDLMNGLSILDIAENCIVLLLYYLSYRLQKPELNMYIVSLSKVYEKLFEFRGILIDKLITIQICFFNSLRIRGMWVV